MEPEVSTQHGMMCKEIYALRGAIREICEEGTYIA